MENWKHFFAHDKHPLPQSLVNHGELQLLAKKSDLLHLIYNGTIPEFPSYCDVKLVNRTVVVTLSVRQVSFNIY